MVTTHMSELHVFNVDDLSGSYDGEPARQDLGPEYVVNPFVDKDGNVLHAVDSTFGFHVTDFVGAEDKMFDGDYAEGFAGNMDFGFPDDPDPLPPGWVLPVEAGLAVRNAKTDIFLSGANNLGTWGIGLGSQATVKQSTEHYTTMAALLSDQGFPGDSDALGPLDDDLRVLDYEVDELGDITENSLHLLWVEELAQALQNAIQNVRDNGDDALDEVRTDIDFDRDEVDDTYRITTETTEFEGEVVTVGAVDLGNDGSIDIIDRVLNGYGNDADITDILEPNEASITSDIAFSESYSITVKDDGKLLYRWGEGVKRPNDIRMEVNLDLPDEWTDDANDNGVSDGLEGDGFAVTRAELIIRHNITNNPNDQVRPEDYENEAAIGRLPAHYIIMDPDNEGNELWVSPVDSFDGTGKALPSYLVLDGGGNVVNTDVPPADSTAVFDPDGVRVGYRNDLVEGTVLKDGLLAAANVAADLTFSSADLEEGFTAAWYTSVNREPFEWSYDVDISNPFINVFESFRSPEEAADAGYSDDDLVSGPRWRLTPNKFGQDLPGLEVPLTPDTAPPYTNANIKYATGEPIVTKLNLLDWEGDSPLATSLGWMSVNQEEVDANSDGLIDEGWSNVNGQFGEDDPLPELITMATSPNGINLEASFLNTAVYVKGDRQDSANLYDIRLELEYEAAPISKPDQDFTADGTSDVLWRDKASGAIDYWILDSGTPVVQTLPTVAATWNVVGTGDLDANGRDEILWSNGDSNRFGYWQVDGGSYSWTQLAIVDPKWEVTGTGDFTGNDTDDILWRDTTSGRVGYWEIDGGSFSWTQLAVLDSKWEATGIGDVTGNGTDDILWRDTSDGRVGYWEINEGAYSWNLLATRDLTWKVVGTGDFDNDGDDDIQWHNTDSGRNGFWEMSDGDFVTWNELQATGSELEVKGNGDYNADGEDDILWRDTSTGQTVYWDVDGISVAETDLGTRSVDLDIVGIAPEPWWDVSGV